MYLRSDSRADVYFVYALTPTGQAFYSSSADGAPIYDQVLSGKLYLSPLSSAHSRYSELQVLRGQAGSTPAGPSSTAKPRPDSNQEAFALTPPVSETPAGPSPYADISTSDDPAPGSPTLFLALGAVLLLGLSLGAVQYLGLDQSVYRYTIVGGGVSLAGTFLATLPVFDNYRLLLIFGLTGLALGLFHERRHPSQTSSAKAERLYTFTAAGIAVSFFFYELFEGWVLNGNIFNYWSLDPVLIILIALAAGAFVFIFTLTYESLYQERKREIVKIMTWLSAFIVIFVPVDPYMGMAVLVVYLFITVQIFLLYLVSEVVTETSVLYILGALMFIAISSICLLLNFVILPALLPLGGYIYFMYLLNETGALSKSRQKGVWVLSTGSFIFHLLFLSIFNLTGLNIDELGELPFLLLLMVSLLLGGFGSMAGTVLGWFFTKQKAV